VHKLASDRELGPASGINRSTMPAPLRESPCTLRTLTCVAAILGVRARDLLADIPDGPEALEYRSRRAKRARSGSPDGE